MDKKFLNKEATMNSALLSKGYYKKPKNYHNQLEVKFETDAKDSMRFCEFSQEKLSCIP
jgi:hypothetical protein